jgi:hypothetical protein
MSSPISRAASMILLCFCLSGCAVGIATTNLKNVPAQPDETRLLQSVGYVIHQSAGKGMMSDGKDKTAWVHALADFTDMGNIFFLEDGKPTGAIHSYEEFSRTHPIVTIELEAIDSEKWPRIFPILTVASLGLIPSYYSEPYTTTFTLSMPGERYVPDLHWSYEYRRQQYLWDVLLPSANYIITQAGAGSDIDPRWKTEEKRRLLLRFLQDAKQPLRELLASARRAP